MKLSQERSGELLVFTEITIWALFPVLIKASADFLPPFFFAGVSTLVAGLFTLGILLYQGKIEQLSNKRALPYMIVGTILITLVFYPFIFFLGQKSTAGNIAILEKSEILFTLILFHLIGTEKITRQRIKGALLITIGALFIVFNNFSGNFHVWDFLILLAYVITPFGNFFQQKAVRIVSPVVHLCFRSLIGGTFLILIALLSEQIPWTSNVWTAKSALLILVNGILALGVSKIIFLEALKRIDVSKAMSLSGVSPVIALFFAFIFLGEIPSAHQIIGFILAFIGVLYVVDNRPQKCCGQVIKGKGLGHQLGFPTINIKPDKSPICHGVFAGQLDIKGKIYDGAVFIGKSETFDNPEKTFEIHLFGFKDQVAPRTRVCLIIGEKIRETQKFTTRKKLIKAIKQDCREIQKRLK